MADFPLIVPTADLEQDQQRQNAIMATQNQAAYQQINDAIDTHAAVHNAQVFGTDRQDAYQQFSDGVDKGLQQAQPADDQLAQMPEGTSPFSFEGFSRAVDQRLGAQQRASNAASSGNLDSQGRYQPGAGQTDVGGLVPAQYNDSQLTSAQANAACGPAAAVAFARANGRNPTLSEAVNLAQQVGWTPQAGMNGAASEKALLDKMGVPSRLESTPNWQAIQQDASSGNPVAISTPQHYFVVDGYDPQRGTYHVGNSGTAVQAFGGSPWMTASQIASAGRGINGVLYADHPLSPEPSVSAEPTPEPDPTQHQMGGELGDLDPSPAATVLPPLTSSLNESMALVPSRATPETATPPVQAALDVLAGSGLPSGEADTADRQATALAGTQPVAQYNQQTPAGTFEQVTRNASGNYDVTPAEQPSADQQAVYDAQEAATHGFTVPDVGAPLLATGASAEPTTSTSPAASPMPDLGAVRGGLDLTDLGPISAANVTGQPTTAPPQGAEADTAARNQQPPLDVGRNLKDAFERFIDHVGQTGAAQAAGQGLQKVAQAQSAVTSSGLWKYLDQGGAGGVPPRVTDEQAQAAIDQAVADGHPEIAKQIADLHSLNKAGEAIGTAVLIGGPELAKGAAILTSLGKGAKAAEVAERAATLPPRIVAGAENAPQALRDANVAAYGSEAITTDGKALTSASVAATPAKVVDTAATKAIDSVVAPETSALAPAGKDLGAATPAALRAPQYVNTPAAGPALEDRVNGSINFLKDVGKALPANAPIEEGANALSRGDNAITVLGAGIHDAIADLKLTPEEGLQVARLREGQIPMSSVSPVVQDVANATDNLAKASYQAANKTGALDAYLENFYAHMVRKPAGEAGPLANFTPSELSSFTKFALSRGRDAAGNVLLPTLDDFASFIAREHPDWQVISDPATVAEAHLAGLGKAANHGAVMDFFKGIVDPSMGRSVLLTDAERAKLAAQDPQAAAYLQQGYRQVDLPASMSRYVYRGQAPESGAIAVSKRGVAGTLKGEQAVVEQQPLVWARSDVADLLGRYLQQDPAWTNSPVMNAYKAANALVVGDKMMNPVIHPLNVVSDVLSSLPRAAVKGSLPGWVADWGKAKAITSDPVKLAKFLQEHDAVLPVVSRYARDLSERTGALPGSMPLWTGIENALGATAGKVRDLNHRVVFEGVVQPTIVHDILQAERQGYDAAAASALASVKYAGIRPSELQGFQKWVTGMGTFAPSWTNGTIAEIGSTVAGRRGLTAGGYGYKLTTAQQTSVANALRADYLSGQTMNFAVTAALNHQLSGHWPWENEPGRWLDIDTGQKDARGRTIYIVNPLFRRQADLLRLAAVPGTPLAAGEGTNTIAAITGKASPVIGAGMNLASGSQFTTASDRAIQGGPPIFGPGSGIKDEMLQAAAFLASQISPANVTTQMATRTPEGVTLHGQNQLTIKGPAGFAYREGQGVTLPQPGTPKDIAAGVVGTMANLRPVEGPRYLSDAARQQAQMDQAYGPDLLKLYGDAGVPIFTAPSTMKVPAGRGIAVLLDTTTAERQTYLAAQVAALHSLATPDAISKLPQAQAARNAVLTKWEIAADEQAKAALLASIPRDQLGRRLLPQFTAPAAR